MTRSTALRLALFLAIGTTVRPTEGAAQTTPVLPSPLSLADVIRVASARRDEIQAAGARTRGGEARPIIASALEDPMISPSLDHLPFMPGGADVSVTIEQRIPLSGIRGRRRSSALADLNRLARTPAVAVNVLPGPTRRYAACVVLSGGRHESAFSSSCSMDVPLGTVRCGRRTAGTGRVASG